MSEDIEYLIFLDHWPCFKNGKKLRYEKTTRMEPEPFVGWDPHNKNH